MEGEMRKEEEKMNEGVMVMGAGVVLLIAGVKHALPTFLEQWRALVFLLVNLVVLTIFFTSLRSNSPNTPQTNNNGEMDRNKKRKRRRSSSTVTREDLYRKEQEETLVVEQEKDELSKEELNARVEAFIVMFKQQLAMDDAQEKREDFSPPDTQGRGEGFQPVAMKSRRTCV